MKHLCNKKERNSLRREENQTDALFLYRSYTATGHSGCVSVLWYKYASKESAGNFVLVAILCKCTVRQSDSGSRSYFEKINKF